MADIELVIKIDEEDLERMKARTGKSSSDYIILNGRPLPGGHGRIGDLDKLIRAMKERNDDNGGEPLNAVDRGYDLAYQHMIEESKECVIIEADGESEK